MRTISAIFDKDSIQTLDCHGDNWHMTWLADGTHLVSLCDGYGFPGLGENRYFNSRLLRLTGHPESGLRLLDVPNYPDLSMTAVGADIAADPNPRYYGFGTLSVAGTVYQYLSTWNMPMGEAGLTSGDLSFIGVKLIYSEDGGAQWRNADGSTPVRWESWSERSSDSMIFFEEPGETFSLVSALQMGADYERNNDGYVYVYAPNGNREGTMNQVVLARVPKNKVASRKDYEFFTGAAEDGAGSWSPDIAARRPVVEFPEGWVNRAVHPYAWQPYVVYNPGLGLYMLASWATRVNVDGSWFAGLSYLSLHSAPTPWGPWSLFHEDRAWSPRGDERERCYQAVIPPGWISEDGRTMWIVWTDFQSPGYDVAMDLISDLTNDPAVGPREYEDALKRLAPFYRINMQKIELEIVEDMEPLTRG